ncbi:MAG: hypothetical protein WEB58_09750 [Planctomycetaceae bacterium]
MNDVPTQPEPNSPSEPKPAADPHENLVAYLDGELPEAAMREVEQQLAQNPVLRRDVEAFQKAWELLDELPQIRATDQFTTKTIASLKIDTLPAESAAKSAPRTRAASSAVSADELNSISIITDVRSVSRRVPSPRGNSGGKAKPLAIAAWFAGLALSAAAGFLVTNRLVPSPAERLLQDLPVIEKWDKFKEVGSLEFLKQYRELKMGGPHREPPP